MTAAQAQASWDRAVRPGLLRCLQSILELAASSGSVTTKVLSTRGLPFPRLAPRTAAFRLVFAAKGQGMMLEGALDVVLLGRGRIDAVMILASFGRPIAAAQEHRLATLVAARLS